LGEAIEDALDQLSDEQREAFVLKHVQGLSYDQMDELLGAGVDALKMRVYRARDRLREILGDRL
jgi:RNA polymerase sigma-70 factor (ECF subfamily)